MPLSRWTSKHRTTLGRKRKDDPQNKSYRTPPKPESYYTSTKGQCRWCGNVITKEDGTINMRKSWHDQCVDEYMIIYHTREARKHVYKRDKGECNYCGKNCGRRRWDLDHIRPLWEQKGVKEKDLDWSYWALDNLQTLCRKCHKEKTKTDTANARKSKKVIYKRIEKFK